MKNKLSKERIASIVAITEIEQESHPSSKEVIEIVTTYKQPKNPPFYVSMKIMDKIAHCCLIDGEFGPNVMSKNIMEGLGLSCTNENPRNMPTSNKQKKPTMGEIKDVTLVMCSHPEIRMNCKIQVIDMVVSNYSFILGRDWQSLIGGYYSMDGTHIIIPKGPKNIIVYKEERIVPYIENLPHPSINFIEDD